MIKLFSYALRGILLLLAFSLPSLAFAAVAVPTITVNGVDLPQAVGAADTMVVGGTNNAVVITFSEDVTPPTVHELDSGQADAGALMVTACGTPNRVFCISYTPPSGINNAFHYFRVSGAQNGTGDVLPPTDYRFIADTVGPTLTLTSGTESPTPRPTVSGTSDEGGVPIGVSITGTNGSWYGTTVAVSGTWSITVPPGSELALGTYTVTASSTDRFGNPSNVVSQSLVLDNAPPVITMLSGPLGGKASTTQITFSFTVTDADPVTVTCSFERETPAPCTSPVTSTLTEGSPRTFDIRAIDVYGNESSVHIVFDIDATPPSLSEVAPIPTGTSTTPSYSFTSTEAGGIRYGGSCASTASQATVGTNTVIFGALAVGIYNDCTITVTDSFGNVSSPLSITPFTIIEPKGSLAVMLNTSGGDGTFTFAGDNGLGSFTISTLGGLGQKQFNDIPAGTYHITQTLPSGWQESSNGCSTVTVLADETAVCSVSDLKQNATGKKGNLIGFVFNDKDGNRRIDKKELTILGGMGQKVYLDANNNGRLDSGETVFTTTIFGIFYFKDLNPSTYTVRLSPKSGQTVTTPTSAGLTATVTGGYTSFAGYFGFK